MSTRRLRLIAVLAAATQLLFAAWLLAGWGGPAAIRAVDDVGLLIFAVFASTCCGWTARRCQGRQRLSWFAMALGLGAWATGESIWTFYELQRGSLAPFPSAADAGFLLFPLAAAAALLLIPLRHSAHSRLRLVLDGMLVAGSLFLISWVTALGTVVRAGADTSFAFSVSLAYPIADLVTITMAVVLLSRARTIHRLSVALLVLGISLMALSDSAFAYFTALGTYHSGSVLDVGWVSAFVVLGLAALCAPRDEADQRDPGIPGHTRIWLPYVPVVAAGLLGARKLVPSVQSGPIPLTAATLVICLIARQFIVLAENRRLMLTISDLAFRDSLTGVANRALFLDRLDHAVSRQQRSGTRLAVLCLDLDGFKLVNDTYGHPIGDQLLIEVARRIVGCLRDCDTMARLGGDEFAILLEGEIPDADTVARRIVEVLVPAIVIDGRTVIVRASIGVATATAASLDVSSDALLIQADHAMYAAKRAGRATVQHTAPAVTSLAV